MTDRMNFILWVMLALFLVDYILANFVEKEEEAPKLGLATNRELIEELKTRREIHWNLGYRTYDGGKQEGTLVDHSEWCECPNTEAYKQHILKKHDGKCIHCYKPVNPKRGKIEPLEPIGLLTLKKLEDKVNELIERGE